MAAAGDTAEHGRFLETFFMESWPEHLRQHHRVTNADRIVQGAIQRYHLEGRPNVRHFIAAEPDGPSSQRDELATP
jgi:hypothetical protein